MDEVFKKFLQGMGYTDIRVVGENPFTGGNGMVCSLANFIRIGVQK